ncbi:hypothetical protein RclHR1_04360014 [Rhizophagus clarus]|uniref:RRM domain-containing protein n=1 Tax=Rhizophagus clarus TaxID=94130 RepID=A0A2Z6SBA0_9GLOM|nr:hypothetical protein RclHR1_04360014 [Rhizophagus clarus]
MRYAKKYDPHQEMWYAKKYDPLQAGSIDGTDTVPHDHGILRAQNSNYAPPSDKDDVTSDPFHTIFVGRLNPDTTEETLTQVFEKFGTIKKIRLVRNIVTGDSRGYAFVEFTHERSCQEAYRYAYKMTIDGRQILVDYERSRIMEGWIPRRMGGGFAGRKESGQLRFGARDRPFKRPLNVAVNQYMPEILPDQRFDDCWRHNANRRGINSSSSATQKYRSIFQYSKDLHFNRQGTGITSYDPRNNPDEERFTCNKRNESPSRVHHEKSIDSFSSRHRVHPNEFHQVENKYNQEKKFKRYSKSRSRSPPRYRHSNREKLEYRRSRSRDKNQDRYVQKYKSHERRRNNKHRR